MTIRKTNDVVHSGSGELWHPWPEKPQVPYSLMQYHNQALYTSSGAKFQTVRTASELIKSITQNNLFVISDDILSERVFPYVDELLCQNKSFTPFLSRTGGLPAARCHNRKGSGFLVPVATWKGFETDATTCVLADFFPFVGFQAATPAALSEKVCRSLLPHDCYIHRPSTMLRRDLLSVSHGGRIDQAVKGEFYSSAYEYDKNKAYLDKSRVVVSPFHAPVLKVKPSLEEIFDYPTGFYLVELIAHNTTGVQPIHAEGGRNLEEGEVYTTWLWLGEIADCQWHGYSIARVIRGYGFRQLSDFLCPWVDRLSCLYEQAGKENPAYRTILKTMMVGLPGRFLCSPERYELRHYSQGVSGDIPLQISYLDDERVLSDWLIHPVPDPRSTALTQVGSYITCEMRRELYHTMLAEQANGNKILRSYIDCYATEHPTTLDILGTSVGQWKEKRYTDVWTEENRFVGHRTDTGIDEMKAPGYDRDARIKLWQKYRSIEHDHTRADYHSSAI